MEMIEVFLESLFESPMIFLELALVSGVILRCARTLLKRGTTIISKPTGGIFQTGTIKVVLVDDRPESPGRGAMIETIVDNSKYRLIANCN